MIDLEDFIDFCGASGHGFGRDSNLLIFIEKILEVGEIKDFCDKMIRLDSILPIYNTGEPHPSYFVCLLWLESVGLIERDESEGGIQIFELTEAGEMILQALRQRRVGFQ